MRHLAVDYGLRRTGLAVCDRDETICSPLRVIDTSDRLINELLKVIAAEQIEAIVVGLPMNMDGSEGPMAGKARAFAAALAKRADLPIHFHDERLTSHKAEELLAPAGLTFRKKRRRLDAVAAAAILQSFLDCRKTENL